MTLEEAIALANSIKPIQGNDAQALARFILDNLGESQPCGYEAPFVDQGMVCDQDGNRYVPSDARAMAATLAHNLQIAAGLCRAFTTGGAVALDAAMGIYLHQWRPGCGRSAP